MKKKAEDRDEDARKYDEHESEDDDEGAKSSRERGQRITKRKQKGYKKRCLLKRSNEKSD